MEVLNTSILAKSNISLNISLSTHNFALPNQFRRTRRNYRTHSSFLFKTPFSNSLNFSKDRVFYVSAHFGRPSRRLNSLRKRLSDGHNLRHDTSTDPGSNYQNPISVPNEFELFEPKMAEMSEVSNNSVSMSRFENWAEQYKKDVEFWGIGSGPLFTVFQGMDGNIDRVSINEDEILRRNGIEPSIFKQEGHGGDFMEVNKKISYAQLLAKEIESGKYVLPRSSSIAKFVVSGGEAGFVTGLRSSILPLNMLSKLPRIGFVVVCSFVVCWLAKEVLMAKNKKVKLTSAEKEMLRRKVKMRMEKEKLESGAVEVLAKPLMEITARPQLNKQVLMKNISKAKPSVEDLMLQNSSSSPDDEAICFNDKIQEIKEMARQAREVERKSTEHEDANEDSSRDLQELAVHKEFSGNHLQDFSSGDSVLPIYSKATRDPLGKSLGASKNSGFALPASGSFIEGSGYGTERQLESNKTEGTLPGLNIGEEIQSCDDDMSVTISIDDLQTVDIGPLPEGASVHASKNKDSKTRDSRSPASEISDSENRMSRSPASASTGEHSENEMKSQWDLNKRQPSTLSLMGTKEECLSSDSHNDETCYPNRTSTKIKPKIILSVKEAKEYLSQKHEKGELRREPKNRNLSADVLEPTTDEEKPVKATQIMHNKEELNKSSVFDKMPRMKPVTNACGNSTHKKADSDGDVLDSIPSKTGDFDNRDKMYEIPDFKRSRTSKEYTDVELNSNVIPVIPKESWMEENFEDFEPIVKKIGDGFRENYMLAKEKVQEELNSEITLPGYNEDDGELEWMKDDSLREIVFQVRENELMGREPFHMMNAEDKQAFFLGLERKVDQESGKLMKLHEWIHSRIENLDYGADGISLYDSPEKIIPRWKGPTVERDPEFLKNAANRQKGVFDENTGPSNPVNQSLQEPLQKSADTRVSSDVSAPALHISNRASQGGPSKTPKIVIESSDGSRKAGKKSGQEYWEHTKKWSQQFLELYNAETDPEVKSVMKDMGKGLNRWITEKEIQETADLMTKIPERKRRYIEKKLDKLKREMKMFGPQAVVSKYREYAEEEEDYLWWLDLTYVLCIELYTNENGTQKVGLYSLEMAEDLELEPKQYHVVAFEDPGDSKSFCYIVQAHMEMLGNGSAFVVAQPPKDAFREAKANGFGVTVIRKGELQLNVDQTLEEVEEQITEIGSKVYHDNIMRDRSVDMGSLMKGVFGSKKPAKRGRQKTTLKKPPATKH